jgi:succinate dehydrogenase / fumarate reductase iron-sulfur subunit
MTQIPASSVGSRSAVRHLTVRIKRYDPERDLPPRWQEFKIDANPMDRVLDVLQAIKWNQDESLALLH